MARLNCSGLAKKLSPRLLKIRGKTFIFKCLGELKFIFDNNEGMETGDQVGTFDEKTPEVKSGKGFEETDVKFGTVIGFLHCWAKTHRLCKSAE